MKFSPISPALYKIEHEGVTQLGIQIGRSRGKLPTLNELLQSKQAFTVDTTNGSIQEWKIEGFSVHEDRLLIRGRWLDTPFSAIDLYSLERPKALNHLKTLARAASFFSEERAPDSRGLMLGAYILANDGTVLILPSIVQDLMLTMNPIDNRKLYYDYLHHPSRHNIDAWLFGFDVLTFRIAFEQFPFDLTSSVSDYTTQVLHGTAMSPQCLWLECPDTVENYFLASLTKFDVNAAARKLDETCRMIDFLIQSEPLIPSHASGEKAAGKQQAIALWEKRKKKNRRSAFYRTHGTRIAIAIILSAVIISVPLTILINKLQPPRTAQMDAHQIVQTFYNCFNSLDTDLIDQEASGSTARSYVDLITSVFLFDKIKTGVQRRAMHLAPEQWISQGKPRLELGVIVFGIDKLRIIDLKADLNTPTRRVFNVSYFLYDNIPDAPRQENKSTSKGTLPEYSPDPTIVFKHERVTVEKAQYWTITKIEDIGPYGP